MKLSRLKRRAGLSSREEEAADINPLEHMANLSDVMLVLAVGILCALLVYWKVDLTGGTQVSPEAVTEEDRIELELEDAKEETNLTDADLEEYGVVYRDEDGTLYLKKNRTE